MMAAAEAITSVSMIIFVPEDMVLSIGSTVDSALAIMEMITTIAMVLLSFDGGMMTAMNMPYKATPKALDRLRGRMYPTAAPSIVPMSQAGEPTDMAPRG